MPRFHIDPDIARAQTISTSFYTDPANFELAKEKIFAHSWLYIGHADLVKEPGDCFPFVLLEGYLDEPLLLTKDKAGKIHLLSNVCTHRGNLLAYEPCRVNQLRCKYHGRIFGLDGQFQSMPEFKEVLDFPTAADNLHSLPLFQWGKLLFTCLDPLQDPKAYFGDMMQRVGWLPLDRMEVREDQVQHFEVKANWALYCENYLEGFHIPFVHAGLNAVLDFGSYTTELFRFSNLQLGIGKKGDNCFELPSDSVDFGKEVAAYYFWTFPNMMFNFYPWGLSLNLVLPLDAGRCKVTFIPFVYDESKREKGAGSGLDAVELEDEEVVQYVQKGIRSRFYSHGRYSVRHEKGTHHFHGLLAERMG
ncbi:aromatic ring-hydroxylating oxygenase subunit alpha [Flavihumibacter petaseus]|uniref:Putative choline monooxygenase n=1 Tax=Flavihumibacter petaseus NBRC 106054 TaxID=1220578 RepID=A0A0E9N626_9BACT|nr:SRPBCC family protein [Flavihumibacter petaseus]GAO45258.1 putative choline monooxygenase [Flavihumibacter petaseus NBRC 106054]